MKNKRKDRKSKRGRNTIFHRQLAVAAPVMFVNCMHLTNHIVTTSGILLL